MKKIYFFFLWLLFIHQSSYAQWTLAGTAFTGTVRGLFFINNDTGYAVGAGGVISKTTDGGSTWTPQTSGVATDLRAVQFVNDMLGYISGASGVVLKTIDGGGNWTLMNAGISVVTLRCLDITAADTIIVGASAGVIYKSTDGGVTWNSVSLGTTSDIIQLDMLDANVGYAVASGGVFPFLNGYVFKTVDGGDTWSQVFYDPNIGLLGLAAADTNTVYAGGGAQAIFKTSDGGSTWDTVFFGISGLAIRSGFALSDSIAYMVDDASNIFSTEDGGATWNTTVLSNGLYSIYFPSLIGYAGNGIGDVYKQCPLPGAAVAITGVDSVCNGATEQYSIDSVADADSYTWSVPADAIINSGQGTTQINVTFGVLSGQVSVTSVSDVCGDGGNISMDVTVNPSPSPTITFSNGVLSSSNVTGNQWYLDGSAIGGATDSTFTPTANGNYYTVATNSYGCTGTSNSFDVVAAQWTALISGVINSLRSVYFINDSVGWVCGESTGIGGTAPILKTTDSGTSWTVINHPTAYSFRGIQFMDANTGIIVGFNGTILRSTDGGDTWDSIPSGTTQPLRSVHFPSHDTGYAAGGAGTILKTIDAGLTWTPQVSGMTIDLINIRFISNDTGYAVQSDGTFLNGGVIKTTDGGATWNSVYSNPSIGLLGLATVDENIVYAGGKDQTIYKTIDGGDNWNQLYVGVTNDNIRGAQFLNGNTGWMVGGASTSAILYTNDGGDTWINQSPVIGTGTEFLGIHFPSSNVGFTVGTFGTILRWSPACTLPIAPTALTGLDSVCSGSTAQFSIDSVSGASSYTWSVPADAVINSGQGTTQIDVTFGVLSGQISATSESACGAGGSIAMNIIVNPSPSPTITFSGNTLSSSDPVGNQWYFNGAPIGGATDSTYTPTLNGTYYTIVTNSYGCSDTSNSIIVIGVGIINIPGSSLAIYPNPSEDECVIYFPKIAGGKLRVMNAAGAIEFSENNLTGELYRLNTASLPSGFYLVMLYDRENHLIATSKLIVQ